uniref:Uncharacterized protein n=1 Tax=Anguilla anguilla TaxID=7936 RepID=A0A0E9WW58_ANGAN
MKGIIPGICRITALMYKKNKKLNTHLKWQQYYHTGG